MAGLQKKYAKMGFKAGWAAYKKTQAGRSRSRSSPAKKRQVDIMAKGRPPRGRGRGRKKFSAWRMMKGIVYSGAVIAPVYGAYQQLGGGTTGAVGAAKAAAFIDPATGSFSIAHGSQIWMPVAVLAVVDFATTKIPIQRKIAQGLNNLLG